MTIQGNEALARYIDPAQKLPARVANPGTPGSFGEAGTYTSAEDIRWVEERWTNRGEDLSVIWDHLYADFRERVPFPIKWEEAAAVIEVIERVKTKAFPPDLGLCFGTRGRET